MNDLIQKLESQGKLKKESIGFVQVEGLLNLSL